MRLSVIFSFLLIFGCFMSACQPINTNQSDDLYYTDNKSDVTLNCNNNVIVQAFLAQQSDVQVKGCGTIVAVLPDDTKGSRHQRLIVALTNTELNTKSNTNPNSNLDPQLKHTILIAHNIDLAPKATTAQKGKPIGFYGEYEYNPKGGVIHWTHHDPAGRHQGGWLEVDGKRYE